MTIRDFLPSNWSAFAEWTANFTAQFNVLASKYNLAGEVAALEKDNAWVQYWIQAKFNARQQEKQLNDLVDSIVNGETGDPQPTAPEWSLPPNPPGNVAAGLKKRLRS